MLECIETNVFCLENYEKSLFLSRADRLYRLGGFGRSRYFVILFVRFAKRLKHAYLGYRRFCLDFRCPRSGFGSAFACCLCSVFHSYFGETAICFLLSLPLAAFAIVTWYKNPYDDSGEVKVSRISARQLTLLILLTAGVTVAFYFILSLLGTASVIWSTVSVTTSFFAAGLTVLRSPYFALGYVANDIILIVLWTIAAIGDPSCVSMVVCFAAFLLNDSYSFICWYRRKYLQAK